MPEVYSRYPKQRWTCSISFHLKRFLGLITGLRNVNIHWPVLPAAKMLADQIHCLLFISVACNGNHKIMRRILFIQEGQQPVAGYALYKLPASQYRVSNGWGPNNALPNSSLTRSSGESSYISISSRITRLFPFLYHRDP